MGYISQQDSIDFQTFKTGMLYGTVMASFACEDFSFDQVARVNTDDIQSRFDTLKAMITL